MARPRIPSAILEAKGSFIRDPQRARPSEPTSDKLLGAPPKHLTADEQKVWKEIRRRVLPGVALESDRDAFELLVRLTHQMRTRMELMKAAELTLLTSLWARFAMTPSDRSKVVIENKPKSALANFLRKKESSAPAEVVGAVLN